MPLVITKLVTTPKVGSVPVSKILTITVLKIGSTRGRETAGVSDGSSCGSGQAQCQNRGWAGYPTAVGLPTVTKNVLLISLSSNVSVPLVDA